MMRAAGLLWRDLERLLLPNACLCCGRLIERAHPDAVICAVCASRVLPMGAGCARCHQPRPPVGPCRFCAEWAALRWARSALWLGAEARSAVHGLKYGGYTGLAVWMAEVITRLVPRPDGATLIPVPLGARRARSRGYNQAACLAGALASRWHLPIDEGAVRRIRETTSQTALDPEARTRNVEGAFRGRDGDPARGGPTAVLIDDVLTTGATLRAAAAALSDDGWASVGAVTFARALDAGQRLVGR